MLNAKGSVFLRLLLLRRVILLSGLCTIHFIEGLVVAFLSWNWVRHELQSVKGFYQRFRRLAHTAAKTFTPFYLEHIFALDATVSQEIFQCRL